MERRFVNPMGSIKNRYSLRKLTLVKLCCGYFLSALPAGAQTKSEWVSTQSLLEQPIPAPRETSIPGLSDLRAILIRSLTNLENIKAVADIQTAKGTKPLSQSQSVLLPRELIVIEDQKSAIRTEVGSVIGKGAQKETKLDFIPDHFQKGFRFSTAESKSPAPSAQADQLRYGLILTDIEPSPHSLRLASINTFNDYEILQFAGKADLRYKIGPIYPEADQSGFPAAAPPPSTQSSWMNRLPDPEFSGSVSPSGLPSGSEPIPAQLIKIEQSQGYYTFEAKLEKKLSPSTALHRFRAPIYQSMNLIDERDKDFKTSKLVLENIYSSGGISCNLEDYRSENRYQAGMIYTRDKSRLELFAHVPKAALEGKFWPQHRWEIKLETSF